MRQQVLFLGALLFFFLGHGQAITVNCGAVPLIVDYCYGNDNTVVLVTIFQSVFG